jgi:hypothetical protein
MEHTHIRARARGLPSCGASTSLASGIRYQPLEPPAGCERRRSVGHSCIRQEMAGIPPRSSRSFRCELAAASRVALYRTTREALEPALARNDVVATTKGRGDPWQ